MAIVAAVGAAVAIAEAVEKVADILDGARTITVELENHTNHVLKIVDIHHDHGGFGEPASYKVMPQTVEVFGVQDSGFMTGCEGRIVHQAEGEDVKFSIYWDNPYAGGNSGSAVAYRTKKELKLPLIGTIAVPDPHSAQDYQAVAIAGKGNQAKFRYEIWPV